MTTLYIATEDALSETVAERLVLEVNHGLSIAVRMGRRGNGYLKKKLPELLKTANAIPILLLTDLDRVACAPDLIADWRGKQILPKWMLFRVAVREVEAWLLADREGFAQFCNAPLNKIPANSELIDDPKQTLLNIVRHYGSRDIKNDILPARGSRVSVGLGYNQRLSMFVRESWAVDKAVENSDSLNRTVHRLRELSDQIATV